MKKQIWNKWYMIALYCLVTFIIGISMTSTDSVSQDCTSIKYELQECRELSMNAVNAWNDYRSALKDYCILDYTNPLCSVLN